MSESFGIMCDNDTITESNKSLNKGMLRENKYDFIIEIKVELIIGD